MSSQKNNFSMSLNELLKDSNKKLNNIIIKGLSLDSRNVEKGNIFFAIDGETVKGSDYINSAIEKGAVAIAWEASSDVEPIQINWRKSSSGVDVPIIAIVDLKQKVGEFADIFFRKPSNKLHVCGITGTNGKTSCGHFLAQIMSAEQTCGLMGTLGKGVYPDLKDTGFTTPDAISCHQWLAELNTNKTKYAVMEVSSHALTQGRVNGIKFESAIFTNLSRDHLDFHGDMKTYADTKTKLFEFKNLSNAIINVDDETGRTLTKRLADSVRCIRYGLNKKFNPDVCGSEIKLNEKGLTMFVTTPWGDGEIVSPVMGRFNASNLLAVLTVTLVQGVEFNEAIKRLNNLESVPGRMQRLGGDEMPLIIVDYAHTPDALEQALITLREHTKNKLWCVFGCGGDRDRGKRPLMGKVAEEQADSIILTTDNPRSEKALNIIEDIKKGMNDHEKLTVEHDRHVAIAYAINNAKAGDVILIAGKGHENYQLIGDKKIPFNDIEEVKQTLEACVG